VEVTTNLLVVGRLADVEVDIRAAEDTQVEAAVLLVHLPAFSAEKKAIASLSVLILIRILLRRLTLRA